jgi:oligoribonuclease NrnB/cAMP/cGMP phosphodiesterase (DHH superfamily)
VTRPLVIYHANCADGFSAAWCFWRKYGPSADYFPGVYQQEPPDVTGRDVYLVDFSYKRPVVETMLRKAASVTLIDHHKTAIEDLRPLFRNDSYMGGEPQLNWYVDIERSGSMLAWQYLFPNEQPPLLLGHIEDRDLWRFKLPGTREIQANVFSYEYTFENWNRLMFADQAELLKMTVAGAAIERKHHKDIAELVKVCQRRMTIGGHDVPVASLPYTLVSDAAHKMAQGEAFAACYWDTAEGRIFGLRSSDDGIDVSEIAKGYGGGGHAKAAGFTVPRDHELARA